MSEGPEPQYTYPGLDEKHKILNFAGVLALEKRRGVIFVAAVFLYTVLYTYAAPYFDFSSAIAAAVLGPVFVATLIVAFYKHKGHYLEWWAYHWIKNLFFRRSVLLFKRREESNPLKKVRDSVQDALRLKDINWYWLKTTDGVYLLVLRVMPYTLSMSSPADRLRLWQAVVRYYMVIDFPVIELARNRPGSTGHYQREYGKALDAEMDATEDPSIRRMLRAFGDAHLSHAEAITTEYGLYDRSAYLMIPYDPQVEDGKKSYSELYDPIKLLAKAARTVRRRPNAYETTSEQAADEEVASTLLMRAEMVAGCLEQIGCDAELLKDNELLAFFASQTRNHEEQPEEPPVIHDSVTLETRRYEKLSESKRKKIIEAAEEVRDISPPVVGTATLSVRDKASPDAIVRNPDTTEVDGRPHKTRYVTKLCDFVQLGVLAEIEALDGDISLIKRIEPKSKEEGVKAYGTRHSELSAVKRVDNDGNPISRNEKEIARESTFHAMNAIQNNHQRYVRLSFLIHMQADTQKELEALDYRVFSVLKGASIESRLTYEEAWEGFLTSLPLGRNYLSASTEFGLLSGPLAGLFSFTTPNLQHDGPGAVLLGLDLSADGQPVIYDDWKMPRPGSLTLGPPDTGKTYLTKSDSTRKRGIGDRVIILDPAANSYYGDVADRIGGVHAALAVGSPDKLNPFDLYDNYMALGLLTDAIAQSVDDDEEVERRARAYALDGKVDALENVVGLMTGRGLTDDEQPVVHGALFECYRLAGITRDPDTHSKPPPTFSGERECDFFKVLRSMQDNPDGEGEIVKGLLRKLREWETGSLCTLFDSQSTVNVYNKYLVIQVASVSEKAKPAVMAAVMECISGVLSNPTERAHFYCDEAHNLLYDENSAFYLGDWTRTGRVRDTSVHLISQNIREFTDTHHGQIIRDNVGTTFVFQQSGPEAAGRIASICGLSDYETRDIERLAQGQCYLIAGPSRHKIQILASAEEDDLFDTSPGADKRRKERKRAQRDKDNREAEEPETDHNVHIPDVYIPPKVLNGKASGSGEEATPGRYATDAPAYTADSKDDTGEIPVADSPTTEIPTNGHAANGHAAYGSPSNGFIPDGFELPPLPGENSDEPTRIYAFTGEGSAEVAASVARLLGQQAQDTELRVLALDAIQSELGEELGAATGSPDPYLHAADPDDLEGLGDYMALVPGYNALFYMEGPAATFLSAAPLQTAIRQVFDCVVVACPETPTVYSAEWLLGADHVVGCSPEKAKDALRAALAAESARGTNGTLLATSAQPADDLEGEADSRALYAALSTDTNARLSLTKKLLTESETDQEEEHEFG